MGRIIYFVGSFLLLCAIPSRARDIIQGTDDFAKIASDREWKIDDAKVSSQIRALRERENYWSGGEINGKKITCSRYCVQKRIFAGESEKNSIKRVNIIWNIVDEARVTLNGEMSSSWGITSAQDISPDNDQKCELYLELGCETFVESDSSISTIYDEFSNSNQKKLVWTNNAVGSSTFAFGVNEITDKLRILVFGIISQVVLEIPIAPQTNDFTDAGRTRPTFSLSPTSDAKGVRIDARNPPPGEWQLRLLGMKNSNYNFTVTAITSMKNMKNSIMKNDSTTAKPNEIIFETDQDQLDVNPKVRLSRPQRLAYLRTNDDNDATRAIKSNDAQLESSAPKVLKTNGTKFSRKANLNRELVELEDEGKISFKGSDESPRIHENSELNDLIRVTEDGQLRTRKTSVDIGPSTELVARPGTYHTVVFAVTNNQALEIRYTFEGKSNGFPIFNVIPFESWIRPGATTYVGVVIQVPNVQDSEPNIVTLYARGNDNFEVMEKSAYVYVLGSTGTTTTDNEKPSIDYSFNDNCSGKLHRDRCARSQWNVEITVNDPGSGLKRVTSLPSGILPLKEFIAGTKNTAIFYYTATCCDPIVDITATDVQGNSYTQKIDVRAWDNLTSGEIAAVVVGALLILLLIIFIILIIVYCIRKRKSHDLSYSQRYGSRTPASAERTNF